MSPLTRYTTVYPKVSGLSCNEINNTTTINTSWEATQRVIVAKLTRLTHKIAIKLHLVAESCTICNSRTRRPVRKLLDTLSYVSNRLNSYGFYFWFVPPEDLSLYRAPNEAMECCLAFLLYNWEVPFSDLGYPDCILKCFPKPLQANTFIVP
jgi:hypothetical protein